MMTMTTSSSTFSFPYVAMHLAHFSMKRFVTLSGVEIFPMWSGEGNLSYLVVNPEASQALLIDPDLEILGSYLLTFQQHNLQLAGVIDTHNHAEHVSAAPELRQLFNVPYYMHQDAPSSYVTHPVQDNDAVVIGGIPVTFLHTPGHASHLVTVKIENHIFTGDSLFLKSCGRADFPGVSDPGLQFDSLQRLKTLPDDILIHPGHNYDNELAITLGESRAVNKWLQYASREEFVQMMNAHYADNEKPDHWEWYVRYNAR